ncbi:MAG: VWA domain-containing protein [Planctomycetota bacterium]|nr:VWA domain-containing protein [Planctomycetota bacterium]
MSTDSNSARDSTDSALSNTNLADPTLQDSNSVMQVALDSAVGVALLIVMLVVGLMDGDTSTTDDSGAPGNTVTKLDSSGTMNESNVSSNAKSQSVLQPEPREPNAKSPSPKSSIDMSPTLGDGKTRRVELVSTAAISRELVAIREEIAAEESPVTPFIETLKAGEVPEVTFFGTKGVGKSVVWIVDQSGSMSGEAFEAARLEVLRSLLNLKGGQRFNVVFFDNSHRYLIDRTLQDASPSGKAAYVRALIDYELEGGGTNPEPAVRDVTEALKPDIIYLLSDGAFTGFGPNTFPKLKAAGVTVHTIGFRNKAGEARLTDIANRTDGTYRFVPGPQVQPNSILGISQTYIRLTRQVAIFVSKLPTTWKTKLSSGMGRGLLLVQRLTGGRGWARRNSEVLEIERRMLGQLIHATSDARFDTQEIRKALRILTGHDFGPSPGGTEQSRAASSQAWQDFWTALRLQKVYVQLTDSQIARELKHEERVRRLAAVNSLTLRSRNMPTELVPLLSDPNVVVRELVHHALLGIAETDVAALMRHESTDRVAAWQEWFRGLETRRVLLSLAPDRAVEALQAPDAASRWAAVQTLADALAAMKFVDLGCKTLGVHRLDPASAVNRRRVAYHQHLLDALVDPSDLVRQRARAILTRTNARHDFGPELGADVARRQLAKQRWEVWTRHAGIGPKINLPSVPVLLKRLQSADPIERIVAIDALAETNPSAPHAIIASLKDPDAEVVKSAQQALRHLAQGRTNIPLRRNANARQIDGDIVMWSRFFERWAYRPAMTKFRMGKQFFDKGDIDTARTYLRETIRDFPGSLGAQQAAELLGDEGRASDAVCHDAYR